MSGLSCTGGVIGTEGRVRKVLSTWGRSGESELTMIKTLENLAAFWRLNLSPQTEYIHHTHLTGPQRMALANKEATRTSRVLRRKN
ncbi:recombinase endonuclease VII [Erwinia phage phiEa1H]|nr:endonuclease VII [Erwinia phage Era103]ABM63415.1 DNA endonuclease-like protein [Erwinia phage Era103]CBX44485.1 recombinase endonuclease VII [Erwinia phage phiEa1H]